MPGSTGSFELKDKKKHFFTQRIINLGVCLNFMPNISVLSDSSVQCNLGKSSHSVVHRNCIWIHCFKGGE